MKIIIHNNNQYLSNIAAIPINGLPLQALTTKIKLEEDEDDSEAHL